MDHITKTQLNHYLDNQLGESELQKVALHLSQCPDCREQAEELKLVFTSLAELPETALARDLTPGILSRLPRNSTWSRSLAMQWGIVLGVSIWSAMQTVGAIRFPTADSLKQFALIKIPVRSLTALQLPVFSLSQVELPSFNLPIPWVEASTGQLALVIVSALVLWVIGNFTLLRNETPEMRSAPGSKR